jgi:uncharacterized protein YecE (DUF72 family)
MIFIAGLLNVCSGEAEGYHISSMAGKVLIGTSGWSYAHWLKGAFYPAGVRGGQCLIYYAGRFGTVEINSTYYRLPGAGFAARWREVTPGGFVFAVKMWQQVTHRKRLRQVAEELERYFAALAELRSKFGPLLIQLPPSFGKDLPRLEAFAGACAGAWKKQFPRRRLRAAMEFRHRSWNAADARALLGRLGLTLVLADMGDFAVDEPLPEGFVYIRRHGPGGGATGYSDAEMGQLAERIRRLSAAGRDVYVYFNNDAHAHAPRNATTLMEMLARRPAAG